MSIAGLLKDQLGTDTRNRRLLQYVLVGLLGLGVNQGVLFLATGVAGLSYVLGGTLSRVLSVLVNYAVNDAWTWGGRGEAGLREYVVRGFKYVLTRIVGIAIGLAALVVFVEVLGLHYLIANVLAVGVGIAWGFGASERWVWQTDSTGSLTTMRLLGRVPVPAGVSSRLPNLRSGPSRLLSSLPRLRSRRGPSADTGDSSPLDAVFDGGHERTWKPVGGRFELPDRLRNLDWATVGVYLFAAGVFLWMTATTFQQYFGYVLTGSDFGSYVHMFQSTVDGTGFLQQGKFRAGHPSGVYWGSHFSLTLLVFLPFYAIWQSPLALLVAKSLVIAASIPLLWVLAREFIESRRLAGLLVLSYGLNPYLLAAWAFDFQEQALLPLLYFGGYLLWARGRYVGFVLVLLLAMLTNEFVIPIAFGLLTGLFVDSYRRGSLSRPVRRTLLAGFGLVVLAHLFSGFVIGQFSDVNGVPFGMIADVFQPFVEGPRVSISEVIPVAATNPDLALQAMQINLDQKTINIIALGLPVLLLAYWDSVSLGALIPYFGFAWFLTERPVYFLLKAHYPFYVLPFVYIGAVRVLGRWEHRLPTVSRLGSIEIPWRLTAKVGLAILLLNASALVVGGMNFRQTESKADADHSESVQASLAAIPHNASLVTQNDLYPHVATRPDAKFVAVDWQINRWESQIGPISPEYVVYDESLSGFYAERVRKTFENRIGTEYGFYSYDDGLWVFKKGYDGPGTAATSNKTYQWITRSREFEPAALSNWSGTRYPDSIISHDGKERQRVWYGPYAALPRGTYTVTYDIWASGTGEKAAASVDVAVGDAHDVIAHRYVGSKPAVQQVQLEFTVDRPTAKVEFRGAHAAPGGTVGVTGVTVTRQTPLNASGNGKLVGPGELGRPTVSEVGP